MCCQDQQAFGEEQDQPCGHWIQWNALPYPCTVHLVPKDTEDIAIYCHSILDTGLIRLYLQPTIYVYSHILYTVLVKNRLHLG